MFKVNSCVKDRFYEKNVPSMANETDYAWYCIERN